MRKYDRPQVVDVSASRARFEQRRREANIRHQTSSKQVPKNQTVEEVVQMHREFPWLYNELGERAVFPPPMNSFNSKDDYSQEEGDMFRENERPPSALHRIYTANLAEYSYRDTVDKASLPMPGLDSSWLAEGNSIPGNCTMVELRTLCAAMLKRVQRMERIARQRGINLNVSHSQENLVRHDHQEKDEESTPEISKPEVSSARSQIVEAAQVANNEESIPAPIKSSDNYIDRIDAGEALRVGSNLTTTIDDIHTTLERLDFVFVEKGRAEEVIRKGKAATKIASLMRKCIATKRYRRTRDSLRSWRRRRGGMLLAKLFEANKERNRKIERVMKEMAVRRSLKIQAVNFRSFARYVEFVRPTRMAQLDGAVALQKRREVQLFRDVFLPWKNIALGPQSRKAVKTAYDERLKAAKASLHAAQNARHESKRVTVTGAMVAQEMRIRAAAIIKANTTRFLLQRVFSAWSVDFMSRLSDAKARSDALWARKILPRTFEAWKRVVESRDEGVGVNKTWAAVKFDKNSVNMRAIAAHADHLCVKHVFRAFRDHVQRIYEVKRRYLQSQRKKLRVVMAEWLARAEHQRNIKRICVDTWRDYGLRGRRVPFRAWYVWARERVFQRRVDDAIINAYMRRKQRLLVSGVFRRWRHQALYADINAMLNRNELVHALKEQKALVLYMQESLEATKATLTQTKEHLSEERKRSKTLTERLTDKSKSVIELRFANHQLESQLVKAQTMIDSLTLIHPGTIARLKGGETSDEAHTSEIALAARAGLKSSVEVEKAALQFYEPASALATSIPQSARFHGDKIRYTLPPLKLPKRDGDDDDSLRILAEKNGKGKKSSSSQSREDFGLVWVTKEDNDVILRVKWAQQKIVEQANRLLREDDESPRDRFIKRKSDEEAWNLRTLVAYLFSGNPDVLHFNKYELKTFIRDDLDAEKQERDSLRDADEVESEGGQRDDGEETDNARTHVNNLSDMPSAHRAAQASNGVEENVSMRSARVEERPIAVSGSTASVQDTFPDAHHNVESVKSAHAATNRAQTSNSVEENVSIRSARVEERPVAVSGSSASVQSTFPDAHHNVESVKSAYAAANRTIAPQVEPRRGNVTEENSEQYDSGTQRPSITAADVDVADDRIAGHNTLPVTQHIPESAPASAEKATALPAARGAVTSAASDVEKTLIPVESPSVAMPVEDKSSSERKVPPLRDPVQQPATSSLDTQTMPAQHDDAVRREKRPVTAPARNINLGGLEALKFIGRSSIDRRVCWNDLANSLLAAFPMQHPANVDAKDKVIRTLVDNQRQAEQNRYFRPKGGRSNIYKE